MDLLPRNDSLPVFMCCICDRFLCDSLDRVSDTPLRIDCSVMNVLSQFYCTIGDRQVTHCAMTLFCSMHQSKLVTGRIIRD